MKERAKQTLRYKKAVKDAQMQEQASTPKGKQSTKKPTEDLSASPEIDVKVHGAEMPSWQDLFIVQIIAFPFYFCKGIYLMIVNWNVPKKSREEILKEQLGMNDEEFEVWKAKQLQKYQQRMNSGKMKRYQRWLKKQ